MKPIQSQSTHHITKACWVLLTRFDLCLLQWKVSDTKTYSARKRATQHNRKEKCSLYSRKIGAFHYSSYNQVRLIETAQVELAQQMADRGCYLPLTPSSACDTIQTYFWWDNFDCMKENNVGSIHTTHGIAFQLRDSQPTPEIQPSQRRTIERTVAVLPQRKINPHRNPPGFSKITSLQWGPGCKKH